MKSRTPERRVSDQGHAGCVTMPDRDALPSGPNPIKGTFDAPGLPIIGGLGQGAEDEVCQHCDCFSTAMYENSTGVNRVYAIVTWGHWFNTNASEGGDEDFESTRKPVEIIWWDDPAFSAALGEYNEPRNPRDDPYEPPGAPLSATEEKWTTYDQRIRGMQINATVYGKGQKEALKDLIRTYAGNAP